MTSQDPSPPRRHALEVVPVIGRLRIIFRATQADSSPYGAAKPSNGVPLGWLTPVEVEDIDEGV